MNERRASTSLTPAAIGLFVAVGLVLVTILVIDTGLYGGSLLSRDGQDLPVNPFQAPFDLVMGKLHWSSSSTLVTACVVLPLLLLVALAVGIRLKRRKGRSRVDYKARLMGTGKDIKLLSEKSALKAAKRFGLSWPGIFLGVTVAGGAKLYADVESVALSIFGPRQGKSSSQVIPAVMDAPGAVVSTSNKPDVVDATRLHRAQRGKVWVFNAQGITDDRPDFIADLLSYVRDDERAQKLSDIFKDASRSGTSKGDDPYFDPEGLDLAACLFLAAALDPRRDITLAYDWISGGRIGMKEPLRILRQARGGVYARHADGMEAQLDLDDGQRDGIVGTAKASLRVLKYVSVQPWVKRTGPYDQRPYFDAEAFARSTDTLYLLSKEGGGSTAAITTALTVAVADAAEEFAMTQPRRRLPVPMVLALDEVANVCVWKELPGKYSHYGSKGLLPMAWLQSYSQGEELWGEKGMKKIYSASTVKVIGSGLDEDHLRSLSSSLNEYRYDTTNVSVGDRKSVSTSPDGGKENIWTVGDLAELPKGRAIVKAAGSRAALVKTVQWIHTPHADAIWFSLELNDPTPESAVAAAAAEKRRTSWNLFQRLVLRKEGERPDELVAAYRAEKSKRAAAASAAAAKWLEVTP